MHTLVFAFVLCAYVLAGSPLIVAASRAVRRTGENQTPVVITALFWLPIVVSLGWEAFLDLMNGFGRYEDDDDDGDTSWDE